MLLSSTRLKEKTPYERILSQTDKDLVKMELDMAWVLKGGKDPLELFKEHPGRFPLWHMKDYDLTKDAIVVLGEGEVDYERILHRSRTCRNETHVL